VGFFERRVHFQRVSKWFQFQFAKVINRLPRESA
jgi:hypothetical protein